MPNAAPLATQPQPENDSRAPRAVAFQTKTGAEAHALRCARQQSPTRTCVAVEFVSDAFRAVEGGSAFQVMLGILDWEVRELPASDLGRLVQAGIRNELGACEWRASAHDGALLTLRAGSKTYDMHARGAQRERSRMRELELLLTVSLAPPGVAADEPVTSHERDSRHAESR